MICRHWQKSYADNHQENHIIDIDGNVLVTSISRKISLIKAVKTAMEKLGHCGALIGGDTDAQCIGRYFTDAFWLMPPLASMNEETLLRELTARRVKWVIPTRDGELLFWSTRRELLARHGIAVMVAEPESIRQCLDKLLFYRVCQELAIPAVPTATDVAAIATEPMVVKERFGAGAKNIGLKLSVSQARQRAQFMERPVFQPFIDGREYSVDAYVDRKGQVKGIVCRTRDIVVNGESQVTTTVHDATMESKCAAYIEKLQLYGHVVMQLIQDQSGDIHIIECNPRFGGASTLSIAAGLDSFYWFLLEATGADLDAYPFRPVPTCLRQVRYPCDLLIPQPDQPTC